MMAGLVWTKTEAVPEHAPTVVSRFDPQPWDWSTGQPQIGAHLRMSLGFAGPQNRLVNDAAQDTFARYLELERAHRHDSINGAGHQVVEIDPLPEVELERLENHFWTTADNVLNPNQRSRARSLLPMYSSSPGGSRVTVGAVDGHGLLAWGKSGVRLEIWRIGTWYHWTVRSPYRRIDGGPVTPTFEASTSATDLPAELRRFWPDADLAPTNLPGVRTTSPSTSTQKDVPSGWVK